MRKKILNHTCLLVVVSMFLTFFAASLVMYSKYNEDLKQSVRDSIRYIQNGVEKMGDSYLDKKLDEACLLYTSPSPRDRQKSRMPSSA